MRKLAGLILLLVVVGMLGAWAVFVPKPVSSLPIIVHIGETDTPLSIGRQLERHGMIYRAELFTLLARVTGLDKTIKTGDFKVTQAHSVWELLQRFQKSEVIQTSVTIVEGWTLAQIRAAFSQHPDFKHDTTTWSDEELLNAVGSEQAHLEGLFFPDTYFFYKGASELSVLRRAYAKMQQELQAAWAQRTENLPYQTPYEGLILASIIEKETAHPADRNLIAQVFVNRLRLKMRLQTDPTVIYGLGTAFDGNLTRKHLRTDTPYNTYTRTGLPPTPIAMPGRASLYAAVQPSEGKYLYFVARGDGSGRSQFSTSLAEHNAAVRKFILKRE